MRFVLSPKVSRPTAEGKTAWTEVRQKEKKGENKQEDVIRQKVVFPGNLPVKQEDPDTFSVPCQIRIRKFEHAMLDLGFAINIMPTPIYVDFQSHTYTRLVL